jgi:hypothetical protein
MHSHIDLTVFWVGGEEPPAEWRCPDCGGTAARSSTTTFRALVGHDVASGSNLEPRKPTWLTQWAVRDSNTRPPAFKDVAGVRTRSRPFAVSLPTRRTLR